VISFCLDCSKRRDGISDGGEGGERAARAISIRRRYKSSLAAALLPAATAGEGRAGIACALRHRVAIKRRAQTISRYRGRHWKPRDRDARARARRHASVCVLLTFRRVKLSLSLSTTTHFRMRGSLLTACKGKEKTKRERERVRERERERERHDFSFFLLSPLSPLFSLFFLFLSFLPSFLPSFAGDYPVLQIARAGGGGSG